MAAMKRARRSAPLAVGASLAVGAVVAMALLTAWPETETATGASSSAATPATAQAPAPSPRPAASASALAADRWPQRAGPVPWQQAPAPSPSPSVAPPRIVHDPIPYGAARRRQMAAYSLRHYGTSTWRLRPRVIVLHYTAGSTYAGARAVFVANAPNAGELPGVAAHFVVDKDGTIYQLVPLYVRVRHAVGLNHRAIAIEMVQEAGSGPRWADAQILARRPQMRSALRLVRYLRARYGIRLGNVIGHSMANDSPYFRDLLGWRNTHVDWQPADVRVFRTRLAALH
jgi:N-acetylmuramoyl-L-alanine amidase